MIRAAPALPSQVSLSVPNKEYLKKAAWRWRSLDTLKGFAICCWRKRCVAKPFRTTDQDPAHGRCILSLNSFSRSMSRKRMDTWQSLPPNILLYLRSCQELINLVFRFNRWATATVWSRSRLNPLFQCCHETIF